MTRVDRHGRELTFNEKGQLLWPDDAPDALRGKIHTRTNARGASIPSNFQAVPAGPSVLLCGGCGREFSAHGTYHPYSWAVDGDRTYALNMARAYRHADRCQGIEVPTTECVCGATAPEGTDGWETRRDGEYEHGLTYCPTCAEKDRRGEEA